MTGPGAAHVPAAGPSGHPAGPGADGHSSDLLRLLAPLACAEPGATAVTAVAVRGGSHATLCHGRPGAASQESATPRTRFETGSLTKTFTAALLADMLVRGEVRADDPIGRYLPPHAVPRHLAARHITLLHLATHTSGLPRLPPNLYPAALPRWNTDPYGGYTPDHLLRAAASARPRHAPGARVHYSNFAVGLLGRLLAEAAGDSYEHLLAARVCAPLALTDTAAAPVAAPAPYLAIGHRHKRPLPPGNMPGLAGAGAVRSSARDLRRWLEAQLRPGATPLAAALREAQRQRLAAPDGDRLALVWNVRAFPVPGAAAATMPYDLYFHSGATRGFTAFAGFSPQTGTGLAALANATPSWRGDFVRRAYLLLRSLACRAAAEDGGAAPVRATP